MQLLTKEGYDTMAKKWEKHSVVYQKWNRYSLRFPTFLKHIDVFRNKNVLEVGCNAGLAAYHIAQVADSYTGVEEQKGYYLQACETKHSIENPRANFLNMSVKTYMKRVERGVIPREINAVYLSYVFYHFDNKEVKMFAETILPQLDVIVIQSRHAKRNKKGRTAHNSYSFWHPDNVKKFLEKNGFSTTLEWGPDKKFHFIVGRKGVVLDPSAIIEECMQAENELAAEIATEAEINALKASEYVKPVSELVLKPDERKSGIATKIEQEKKDDGDKGSSGVYTEGQSEASKGRSTRSGEGRVAQRKPRSITQRKTNTQRPRGVVRAKKPDEGSESVLQPVVEKSAKAPIRKKDIPQVDKTVEDRGVSETGENSKSQDKFTV